jgi:mRNA interferase MazF
MPSTTTYQPGELVLVSFPHTSGGKAVVRPAIVILGSGDVDLVLARVTTQQLTTSCDVAISDWRGACLLAPSFIRLHKLATLEKSLILRRVGSLQPIDRLQVSAVMKQTYGNG